MKIHIRNVTFLSLIFVFFVAAVVLTPTYREFVEVSDYATSSYEIEYADTLTAQAIASWTSTITLIPTITLTPSRTPSPTLSPTITLTPTVAPCISSVKDDILTPILYGQPSQTDTPQNQKLVRGAEVRLYFKLNDEPWLRASRYGVSSPEGWIYEPDLSPSCGKLPAVSLKYMAEPDFSIPLIEESFSRIPDDWLDSNDKRVTLTPSKEDGYSQLWLDTIMNGEPVLEILTLQQTRLPEHWKLWTALQRVSLSGRSYIGFRIYPGDKENTYIEIRFYRESCNYEYVQSIDGQVQTGVPIRAYDGCISESKAFITLEGEFDRAKSLFILTPTYNGRRLLTRDFSDAQGLFSSGKFNIISSGVEGTVDYILLMESSD